MLLPFWPKNMLGWSSAFLLGHKQKESLLYLLGVQENRNHIRKFNRGSLIWGTGYIGVGGLKEQSGHSEETEVVTRGRSHPTKAEGTWEWIKAMEPKRSEEGTWGAEAQTSEEDVLYGWDGIQRA